METSITGILREDHKKIRGLFAQAQAAPLRAPEMDAGVLLELFMELEIHSQIEEEFFYPAFQELVDVQIQGFLDDSFSAHRSLREQIGELRVQRLAMSEYQQSLEALRDTVLEHFEVEERQLFPTAEKFISDREPQLIRLLLERRTELHKLPQYASAQPEVVQDPNGGEQLRVFKGAA